MIIGFCPGLKVKNWLAGWLLFLLIPSAHPHSLQRTALHGAYTYCAGAMPALTVSTPAVPSLAMAAPTVTSLAMPAPLLWKILMILSITSNHPASQSYLSYLRTIIGFYPGVKVKLLVGWLASFLGMTALFTATHPGITSNHPASQSYLSYLRIIIGFYPGVKVKLLVGWLASFLGMTALFTATHPGAAPEPLLKHYSASTSTSR